MMERKQCGLILALDVATPDAAREFLDRLDKATRYVKIGPRLYAMGGLPFVKEIIARGYDVFLDLIEDYFAQPEAELRKDERPELGYQVSVISCTLSEPGSYFPIGRRHPREHREAKVRGA